MDIATLAICIFALIIGCLAFWSSHRSANADEASLELQKAAAQPRAVLVVEYMNSMGSYRLKNVGDAPAEALALAADDEGEIRWDEPLGDVLHPGDSRRFSTRYPASLPARLRFTREGQDEVVRIPFP